MNTRLLRLAPWLIIVLFVTLSVAWSLVVPPFETPDEPYHYAFARHLAQGNPLPVQSAQSTGPWEQEGSQAPLYYMLAGALTRTIDQNDFEALAVRNPRANIGDPLYPGNKNFMLYSGIPHALRGANLALHAGRWLSVLLGVVTLLATWGLARIVFATRPWLAVVAMALVAVIPQFVFLSGSFSNDTLVTAISALTLWWLATLLAKPADEAVRWWHWLILGVLLGIAALSKLQGLGLFVLAAATGAGMMFLRRDWWLPVRAFAPVALPPALLAGWWYLRNIRLYGDWTGLNHLLDINGRRVHSLDLADWWVEFRGLRYSFWGLFGWFNILLPDWLYLTLDVISVIALGAAALYLVWSWVGAGRGAASSAQAASNRVLLLAAGWALLTFALLVYWTVQATGSQGRLLFPAISALAVLVVAGLHWVLQWLPTRIQATAWSLLLALLLVASVLPLFTLLPAAYRQPAPVAEVSDNASPVNLRFGAENLELLAVEIANGDRAARFQPGDDVPVRLYLRASARPTSDYMVFMQLLDESGLEIANVTTHPGWGNNPTTLWQPGAIYADDYLLRITGAIAPESPLLARLYTGYVEPDEASAERFPLEARNAAGEVVTPFVESVAVRPREAPASAGAGATQVGAHFGDVIELVDAAFPETIEAGATLTTNVLYAATGTPATVYVGYVHLLDDAGNQVAGYDQEPAAQRFPTSHWRAGDHILTHYTLALPANLPPGTYELWSGLYAADSAGALRLPVTDAGAAQSGDGQVRIGTVTIVAE